MLKFSSEEVARMEAIIDGKPWPPAAKARSKFRAIHLQEDSYLDSVDFLESLFSVEHAVTGEVAPIRLNRAQQTLNNHIEACWSARRPCRFTILKARRFGLSRFMLLKGIEFVLKNKSAAAAIVANTGKPAASLRDEGKRLFRKLPYSPKLEKSNRETLQLGYPWHTAIRIESADSPEPLRGETRGFRFLHCTETAYWSDPTKVLGAILPTVPNQPGTLIGHESTGNGQNWFYEFWWNAHRNKNGYTAFFFPWWIDPDFNYCDKLTPLQEREFKANLDDEEKALMKGGLSMGQLSWRRRVLRTDFYNDIQRFQEAYPASPEEAFLQQGNAVFNRRDIAKHREACEEPLYRFAVVPGSLDQEGRMTGDVVAADNGPLHVWRQPKDGHWYVMGVDCAEGVGQDDSVIQVLDYHTHEQVACYRSNTVAPTEFGRVTAVLGRRYNDAAILIERNTVGAAVINATVEAGYLNLLRMVREDWSSRPSASPSQIGWRSTGTTKPRAFASLREALSLPPGDPAGITVRDAEALDQANAMFVENNRYLHPKQGHDDLVDALTLATMACQIAAEADMIPTQPGSRKRVTLDQLDRDFCEGRAPEPVAVMEEDEGEGWDEI